MNYFASKNRTSIIKRFLVGHVTEFCCEIGAFCNFFEVRLEDALTLGKGFGHCI